MNTQRIILDFCKNEFETIILKQYDNDSAINISFTIVDSIYTKYSSYMCNVKMVTPMGKVSYKSEAILDDGTVSMVFNNDILYKTGTGKLELQIIDSVDNTVLFETIFTIIIIGNVYL